MKRSLKTIRAAAAVLLALASVAVFAGCKDDSIPRNMTSAAAESEPFYFYVPKSWVVNTSGGTASAYYSAADRSNVSLTAMVMDVGLDTVELYMENVDKTLAGALPAYSKLTEPADTSLGGLAAKTYDYTAELDGTVYKFRQTVTAKGYDFFIFTYTSTEENFDSHLEDIESILTYISFK
ncbi:MAG: hypothetical protein IJU46_03935 [Clostridia bacterium]|nr:hypothetical protein [Clostridia bacterium]